MTIRFGAPSIAGEVIEQTGNIFGSRCLLQTSLIRGAMSPNDPKQM
jgi:hypothetical protein